MDWSLSGEDAALFTIDADGKLSFKAAPDFEDPKDQGKNNLYELTLVATDAAGNSRNQPLKINVGDQDENTPRGGGVYERTVTWTLDAAEQDAYALVMISRWWRSAIPDQA